VTRLINLEWNDSDDPPTLPDPTTQRRALADALRELTPVDLLWMRTRVEEELQRRGFSAG